MNTDVHINPGKPRHLVILLIGAAILMGVSGYLRAQSERGEGLLSTSQRLIYTRPEYTVYPESAPYSPQIATLGKMLFFDPRVSRAQNMSCSSCHNPSFGWETPVSKAIGAKNIALRRHAPTVVNLNNATALFWDGRVSGLEEQARGPITNPLEMNMKMQDLVLRLKRSKEYTKWFELLFPGEGLTEWNILRSIATFERSLESGWSDFDEWIAGDDDAISLAAKRGFHLFDGKGNCTKCHTGWSFTDHRFHDIGLDTDDPGRFAYDDSFARNMHAFKTPTLRNISLRAPYMHDGSFFTLESVIGHYSSGGIERDSRSPLIHSIGLTSEETRDIVAFLETLTEKNLDVSTPVLPAN